MNNQVIEMGATGERLLTASQYADRHGKAHRTVKRWIQDGRFREVATQDSAGRWLLPADALPADAAPEPAPQSEALPLGTALDVQAGPATVAAAVALRPAADNGFPAPLDELRALPAYVDVPTAARLLGIPEGAVRRNGARFGAEPFGPHGSLVVPAAAIRAVAGL